MSYVIPFVLASILSYLLTPFIRRLAIAHDIVDQPGGRHIHTQPIAKFGGLAIFLVFWLLVVGFLVISPSALGFVPDKLLGIDRNLVGVFLGAMILLITGVIDDIYGLSPAQKLFWQSIAAFMPVAFGIRIWWLSNPLGGPNIMLGNWTYLLVPMWLVLMINVVNWLDGLDGLATGVSSIAALILFFLSLTPFVNQPATALLAIMLAGAGLGFLPHNFHPAKIFLGDTGSQFLGYMLGIFAIISGGKVATAALVLGIPIFDAVWVVIRRILTRQSPFVGDRQHLHHRLIDSGLTQRQTVWLYWLISAIFGVTALFTRTSGKIRAAAWLLAIMVVVGLTTIIFRQSSEKSDR